MNRLTRYRTRRFLKFFVVCVLGVGGWNISSPSDVAQTIPTTPQSLPSPEQKPETIKVYTEEVLLPVVATDGNGRFDPTLESNDLLILENGVPQTVQSIRRTPASVLLLLDTGGARNPAMRTNTTRDLAIELASLLRSGDQVAALQFGGKVELIQDWTTEQSVMIHSLRIKLSSGKRGRLLEALAAASAQVKDIPLGNTHVVLITDGGESPIPEADLAAATNKLIGSQATIHIISYTQLGRKTINKEHPKVPVKVSGDKPKGAQETADELTRPNAPETLDTKLKRKIYVIGDTDLAIRRSSRDYVEILDQNELRLTWLAEKSGGAVMLPTSTKELMAIPRSLANEIDSQYVVTYRPRDRRGLKSEEQSRHIEVVPRRAGLIVYSRRTYVLPDQNRP